MSKVQLAKGLAVPAEEIATQVVAAIGMRGSGKSNIMAVIVEGLLAAEVQVIVLDYVGIWPSLRLDESGKRPSPFAIPVLGGPHGDTALVPGAGKVVAETLARSGSPAVVDVSGFTKGGRCAFATDLAEALFAAKKQHPGPTFLVLEEAQRFIPQKLYAGQGQERMLGAFEEIAEVGRNYGLGLGMISQRPQKLAKDVLNLTELLFAFQANGVLERKAIAEWVQEKDAEGRSEVNNELPSLARGEALVWSPSWLRIYGRYHTHKKVTYDAGATPTKARAAMKVKPLDIAALETAMAEVVEAGKQDDPKALRAEVARLRAELARAGKAAPSGRAARAEVRIQVPPALRQSIAALGKQAGRLAADLARATKSPHELGAAVEAASKEAALPALPARPGTPPARGNSLQVPGHITALVAEARVRGVKLEHPLAAAADLSKAARALLTALAQLGGYGTDSQISIVSGYSITSSSFKNARGELNTAGLIEYTGDEARQLTAAGREATALVDPLPTGGALLDWWLRHLGKCERTLLQTLFNSGGRLAAAELSERSGYSQTSSSFKNGLGLLRSGKLIGGHRGGVIELAPTFLENP